MDDYLMQIAERGSGMHAGQHLQADAVSATSARVMHDPFAEVQDVSINEGNYVPKTSLEQPLKPQVSASMPQHVPDTPLASEKAKQIVLEKVIHDQQTSDARAEIEVASETMPSAKPAVREHYTIDNDLRPIETLQPQIRFQQTEVGNRGQHSRELNGSNEKPGNLRLLDKEPAGDQQKFLKTESLKLHPVSQTDKAEQRISVQTPSPKLIIGRITVEVLPAVEKPVTTKRAERRTVSSSIRAATPSKFIFGLGQF